MTMHPNINVVSRSNAPKKIVHSIWVREYKNIHNPGQIYGKIDLVDRLPAEKRTTGGDPLNFVGPTIKCRNLKPEVEKVMRCPIWNPDNRQQVVQGREYGQPSEAGRAA